MISMQVVTEPDTNIQAGPVRSPQSNALEASTAAMKTSKCEIKYDILEKLSGPCWTCF